MGNRSDRRFANLANPLALEAVVPIRTRRVGFHHGPEQITELLTEAVYTNATGFTLIDRAACDRGWVHIREFESIPLRPRVPISGDTSIEKPASGLICRCVVAEKISVGKFGATVWS